MTLPALNATKLSKTKIIFCVFEFQSIVLPFSPTKTKTRYNIAHHIYARTKRGIIVLQL